MIDEYLKGQRKLDDIPVELHAGAKDLAKDIKSIISEFKKVLPKGKEADELAKELGNVEINNISKFGKLEFQGINMGVNCFIAKTNTLKNNKWDENKGPHGDRKGNTEHEDFFFRLWLKNINIKYCKHFYFKQANEILRKYDKNGKNLRKRKFDKSNIYKLLIQ